MRSLKNHFKWALGLSVLTGLAGSLILKNKQNEKHYDSFIGEWTYQKRPNNRLITVTVTPEYRLMLQDRIEPVTIVELTPTRLVFLDRMGYHIIFEKTEQKVTFYDETEDHTYLLKNVKKSSKTVPQENP